MLVTGFGWNVSEQCYLDTALEVLVLLVVAFIILLFIILF